MAECSGSVVSNNVNTQKQSSAVQSTASAEENKTDKVMEPILLEDFNYNQDPKTLQNLLEFFEKNHVSTNRNDILVGLIYILMLESGFVPVEQKECYEDYNFNYRRVLELSKTLPRGWKRDNLYTISFVLPPYLIYECKFAIVLIADDLLVNCIVSGVENGNFNTILDPLTYFLSSNTAVGKNKLQNLNHLSRTVKSCVCNPAKQIILKENDVIVSCFEQLPPEIILLLMSYLNVKDLIRLGRVNRFLYELMKTPKLWTDCLKRDFEESHLQYSYLRSANKEPAGGSYEIARKFYARHHRLIGVKRRK